MGHHWLFLTKHFLTKHFFLVFDKYKGIFEQNDQALLFFFKFRLYMPQICGDVKKSEIF